MREAAAIAAAKHAVIVTTEKDADNFPAETIKNEEIPVFVMGIEIEMTAGEEEVKRVLKRVLGG